MLRPYGMLLRQDGAEEESQKSRPSQRTLGESPRDSQDGPGATKVSVKHRDAFGRGDRAAASTKTKGLVSDDEKLAVVLGVDLAVGADGDGSVGGTDG